MGTFASVSLHAGRVTRIADPGGASMRWDRPHAIRRATEPARPLRGGRFRPQRARPRARQFRFLALVEAGTGAYAEAVAGIRHGPARMWPDGFLVVWSCGRLRDL